MHVRVQIVSILFASLVFVGVLELVRRRRVRERYAILWLVLAAALLVLAIWQDLLNAVSKAVGIYYPPSAFFVIAFAFLLLLLLHFSAAVSRLGDETRILAQRLAILEEQQKREREWVVTGEPPNREILTETSPPAPRERTRVPR